MYKQDRLAAAAYIILSKKRKEKEILNLYS